MNSIGSNSVAAQIYNGIQSRLDPANKKTAQGSVTDRPSEFRMPANATPKGDWVLSENANPQNFDPNAARGSYLNLVV